MHSVPPSLTGIRVYGIARCVAAKYHLPMPNLARIQQNFRCAYPYVYLTRHHIRDIVCRHR